MMDPASPLTRQTQEYFQPKIVHLYSLLFSLTDEDFSPTEGFWREFFLLRPEKQRFKDILDPLTADDLLHIQRQTRSFVQKSISEVSTDSEPQNENALENLTAFLTAALAKKYTNPSTDMIEVLAGLESVDRVMSELVNALDTVVSKSQSVTFRRKAVDNALAVVSGSYQTSLVTYFIHKDFFHGFVKYVQKTPEAAPAVLSILGLLANYNKFEAQNIYRSRMEDFINEQIMVKLVDGFANTCGDIRDTYVAVQDDAPPQWTIGTTLSYVGLRALTPEAKKPLPPTEDEAKALFNALPGPDAMILLATYTFVQANNIFASHLLSTDSDDDLESPLAAFLSTTSYLCHHAYRSIRTLHYSLLSLFTIRSIIDDSILAKRLSSPEAKITVRLARQKPPHLPYIGTARIPTAVVFDILTDTLSHNLRKRLSLPLYFTALTILHHILTQLSATRTRIEHHWSYIWLSLVSLLRFLTAYSTELIQAAQLRDIQTQILVPLTSILTFSLLRGDSFLPDPQSYDDIFYKLVETADTLTKFEAAYDIPSLPPAHMLRRATAALTSIAAHYHTLLSSSIANSKKPHHSPREVQRIIGQGHETLADVVDNFAKLSLGAGGASGAATDEFGHYDKWREAAWKVDVKRIIRTAVDDARALALL